jgi:rhamnogalacturonyl hydrolase YesR
MRAGQAVAVAFLISAAASGQDRKIAVGLTSGGGAVIEGAEIRAASAKRPVVVHIGGLDGQSSDVVLRHIEAMKAKPAGRRDYHLIAIPHANPARAKLAFPPTGVAYRENTESHYLWRWIGMQAPDLVIVADKDDFGLKQALSNNAIAGMGKIPVAPTPEAPIDAAKISPSDARREFEARRGRKPEEVANELAQTYGHALDDAVYIPAVALIGRARLGDVDDVRRIVAPYADGTKDSLRKPTASHMSGHLIFADLAERTGDKRYIQLVKKAADSGYNDWNEMSDGVFMGCPIFAKAGKLTGERKYFDMTLEHFRYMAKLCRRPDGLYRHSPLDEAAWGRGNAFPALGLALALSDMPKEHLGFTEMRDALRNHLAALSKFQDESGMWRQVIDKPGVYREFSATAMIGVAMLRAVRNGWVDAKTYQPRIDNAWKAVASRTRDGVVVDVCEGTGKQKLLVDYLNRAAILDKDPRGGAMALLFATEMAGLK